MFNEWNISICFVSLITNFCITIFHIFNRHVYISITPILTFNCCPVSAPLPVVLMTPQRRFWLKSEVGKSRSQEGTGTWCQTLPRLHPNVFWLVFYFTNNMILMLLGHVLQDIVTKMLHVDPHQRLTAPQVMLLSVVKMFHLYIYFFIVTKCFTKRTNQNIKTLLNVSIYINRTMHTVWSSTCAKLTHRHKQLQTQPRSGSNWKVLSIKAKCGKKNSILSHADLNKSIVSLCLYVCFSI